MGVEFLDPDQLAERRIDVVGFGPAAMRVSAALVVAGLAPLSIDVVSTRRRRLHFVIVDPVATGWLDYLAANLTSPRQSHQSHHQSQHCPSISHPSDHLTILVVGMRLGFQGGLKEHVRSAFAHELAMARLLVDAAVAVWLPDHSSARADDHVALYAAFMRLLSFWVETSDAIVADDLDRMEEMIVSSGWCHLRQVGEREPVDLPLAVFAAMQSAPAAQHPEVRRPCVALLSAERMDKLHAQLNAVAASLVPSLDLSLWGQLRGASRVHRRLQGPALPKDAVHQLFAGVRLLIPGCTAFIGDLA